ncbi:tRNA pseudouridine(55) synthase TruB [Radiobacillus kanasensis]|uniref:tRNA pseudouridine(55) synthase TruB n=1 Tax=Radiobacillus kanasensis TaxID=2844358 RepID=UPI001E40F396|nr:tRNA pseudouridine(55) synthase TruB [Radiobacillus kanasensis]UFU01070.1 tRNA pseudouridine(55) synthase TruB [Radiobacillus kanasensis]
MDGILPLWKPKGWTSHDCVMKVRRLFKTKKVGHTGTLDPDVEGVLPICIGRATKIVPFLTDTTKTYQAELLLGYSTETEDSSGTIIEKKELSKPVSDEEIAQTLSSFIGEIAQIPPMYSAVKVNGKKLYEYAREGKTIERPVRHVQIFDIKYKREHTSFDETEHIQRISLEVICSKGTYIRTLCVDIGKAHGFPAHMSHLIRTATGSFSEQDTFTLEQCEQEITAGRREYLLAPIQKGVDHLPVLEIKEHEVGKVLTGQKLKRPEQIQDNQPFRVEHKGELLAIYHIHPEKREEIKPVRVLKQDEK